LAKYGAEQSEAHRDRRVVHGSASHDKVLLLRKACARVDSHGANR